MFTKNVAISYYPIGVFISVATGLEVTTGVATGKYSKDGVGDNLSGAIAYNTSAGEWGITGITAAELNGDTIGLKFTLTGCYPVHHTIKTYVPQAVLPLNSITNDSLATSAITEIQAGLSVLTAAQVQSEVGAALAAVGLTVTVTGRINDTITSRAPADKALSTDTWNNARALNLDNLNDTITSRAPADTALSTDVWLDGRAINLDNLNDTISSRAPAVTALSTDIWTEERAAKLDEIGGGSSSAPTAAEVASAVWKDLLGGGDFSEPSSIGKFILDNDVYGLLTGANGIINIKRLILSNNTADPAVEISNTIGQAVSLYSGDDHALSLTSTGAGHHDIALLGSGDVLGDFGGGMGSSPVVVGDYAVGKDPATVLYNSIPVNTTTFLVILRGLAAVLLGELTEPVDPSTSSFCDVNDPGGVPRVTAVNTATMRSTTIH